MLLTFRCFSKEYKRTRKKIIWLSKTTTYINNNQNQIDKIVYKVLYIKDDTIKELYRTYTNVNANNINKTDKEFKLWLEKELEKDFNYNNTCLKLFYIVFKVLIFGFILPIFAIWGSSLMQVITTKESISNFNFDNATISDILKQSIKKELLSAQAVGTPWATIRNIMTTYPIERIFSFLGWLFWNNSKCSDSRKRIVNCSKKRKT